MNLVSSVEFQMSLLLFCALAGSLIAAKFKFSSIISTIFLGLIVGPSVLSIITYTDFVAAIAHIGAIVLLFVIGLEFKIHEIFKPKYALIALVGVIVPWIGGYLTATLFGYSFAKALFVGTALTATSIAITAKVLKDTGTLSSRAAQAVIGAAVIDDIFGLMALSVTNQAALGSVNLVAIMFIVIKAALFLIIGTILGITVINKILQKIDKARMMPEMAFIFAMMIAFLFAMISEAIALSAIVGAFLAGVVLEGVNLKHSKDFREGAEYLSIIFSSLFFVSLGILANVRALNMKVIIFFIVLTVVAFLTKFVGCYIAARMSGLKKSESTIVGIGMTPRGEVAMIVGLLALTLGIIGQEIYVTIIMMSLATAIIAPIILKKIIKQPGTNDLT